MPKNRAAASVTALALITIVGLVTTPSRLLAAAKDYRFELVGTPVKSGKATLIKIRLVHIPNSKAVPGAIIIQTKFDMGPDGMASMSAPAKASASPEAGIYQIEAEPPMGGNWALALSAKVQGEAETVSGTVTVAIPK